MNSLKNDVHVEPPKSSLRQIALSFNPENEEYSKETCLAQARDEFKSSISKHDCYNVRSKTFIYIPLISMCLYKK